jgi:hypothetical protein
MQKPASPPTSVRPNKLPTRQQLPQAAEILRAIPGTGIEDILSDIAPAKLWKIQDLIKTHRFGIGDTMGFGGISTEDKALIERYLKALEEKT